MRRQLQGGAAIVTGASSGIGRELARQLALEGVRVLVTARRAERLRELVDQIQRLGGEGHSLAGDITDPSVRAELIEKCQRELGGLDFLINNAGVGAMGRFQDASPARLRQIMEVNFFAPAEMMRLAIPLLAHSSCGIIVNMGSVLGHRAVGLKSEYCASKFALHGLSDAVRSELESWSIDVLHVSPSTTDSEFFTAALEDNTRVRDWKGSRAASPELVAQKVITAMKRGSQEIVLTPSGKILVWLDRLFPRVANRLVARDVAKKGDGGRTR